MASANVDLVRSIYAAWARGDYSPTEWANPEIEWVMADGPAPGTWVGLSGMAEGVRGWLSAWEDARVEPDEYHELDDERILVFVHYGGRGRTSGVELERIGAKAANVFHIRGGKVTKMSVYFDRDHALADLGLAGMPPLVADRPISQRNVDVVRSWVDAFNRRDFEALIRLSDPEIEFRSILVSIESVFRGLEAFPYEYFSTLDEAYDHFVLVPLDFIDVGAAVVLDTRIEWRGKSGTEGATPVLGVSWLRAGKIFRQETFTDRAEAFEAAGLSHSDQPDSKSNVELTRQLVEAVAQRDVSRLIELTDPKVEWHSIFAELGEGGVYRGHDGLRRYVTDLVDAWDFWRFSQEDILAVGDLVLQVGHMHYRGRDSGIETTSPAGFVLKFHQGKAVYMRSLRDPEQALEAAARGE